VSVGKKGFSKMIEKKKKKKQGQTLTQVIASGRQRSLGKKSGVRKQTPRAVRVKNRDTRTPETTARHKNEDHPDDEKKPPLKGHRKPKGKKRRGLASDLLKEEITPNEDQNTQHPSRIRKKGFGD